MVCRDLPTYRTRSVAENRGYVNTSVALHEQCYSHVFNVYCNMTPQVG